MNQLYIYKLGTLNFILNKMGSLCKSETEMEVCAVEREEKDWRLTG